MVIGVSDYNGPSAAQRGEWDPAAPYGFKPLLSVRRAVTNLLSELRNVQDCHIHGDLLNPTSDEIMALWHDARSQRRPALVMYFAGHARTQQNKHLLYLAGTNTDPDRLRDTGVELMGMLNDIDDRPYGPNVLFLLDTCGAGNAVNYQMLQGLKVGDRRSWVIAAAAEDERAFGARFTKACGNALSRVRRGLLDLSASVEFVPVETLAAEVDRELARLCEHDDRPVQTVLCTPVAEVRRATPPFFVNPAHRTLPTALFRSRVQAGLREFADAAVEGLDPVHFLTRAEGSPQADYEQTAVRCFFSGREPELRRIKDWFHAPNDQSNQLLLVTGAPGMGKSALLGVVACLAHPQLRQIAGTVRSAIPHDLRPDENPNLACVHARQRTASQVWSSIVDQMPLEDWMRRVWSDPSSVEAKVFDTLDLPFTVLIDALDESVQPKQLLHNVLLPMLDMEAYQWTVGGGERHFDRVPVFRLLLGTRPQWERFDPLREHAEQRGSLLNLDQCDPELLRNDLALYLEDLLEDGPVYSGAAMRTLRKELASTVSDRLSTMTSHGPFLLGGLFAHSLNQLSTPLNVDEALERLPLTLPGLLQLKIDADRNLSAPWAREVLTAIGHAKGEGMPLELIVAIGSGLFRAHFPDPQPSEPTFEDVRDLLRRTSFYYRHAVDEDGRQLYRFFHQSLSDYFTGMGEASPSQQALDTAKVCASLLFDTIQTRSVEGTAVRDWSLALPYVRRHAWEHAQDADDAEHLLEDLDFVTSAGLLHDFPPREGSTLAVQLLRAMRPISANGSNTPASRRCRLCLAAVHLGRPDIVESVLLAAPLDETPQVMPRWTDGPLFTHEEGAPVARPYHLTVRGTPAVLFQRNDQLVLRELPTGENQRTVPVGRASLVAAADGRGGALAMTALPEGSLTVWDLETGQERVVQPLDVPAVAAQMWQDGSDTIFGIADGESRVTTYSLGPGDTSLTLRDITERSSRTPESGEAGDSYKAALADPSNERELLYLTQSGLKIWDRVTEKFIGDIDIPPDEDGVIRAATCCDVSLLSGKDFWSSRTMDAVSTCSLTPAGRWEPPGDCCDRLPCWWLQPTG